MLNIQLKYSINMQILYLPLYKSLSFLKCKHHHHLLEYEGDGVGLLVQVEAVFTANVVCEVGAALGGADPPLSLPAIPPELECQAV